MRYLKTRNHVRINQLLRITHRKLRSFLNEKRWSIRMFRKIRQKYGLLKLNQRQRKSRKNCWLKRYRLNRSALKSSLSLLWKSIRFTHDDHQNGQRYRSSNLCTLRFPRWLGCLKRYLKQRTLKRKIRINFRIMQQCPCSYHRYPRIRRLSRH